MRHIYNEGDLPKKVHTQTYTHAGTCKLTDERGGLTHAQTNTRDKSVQVREPIRTERRVLLSQTHTGTSNTKIWHIITQQAKHNVQPLFEESHQLFPRRSPDQSEKSSP